MKRDTMRLALAALALSVAVSCANQEAMRAPEAPLAETPKTFTAYSRMLARQVTFNLDVLFPPGDGPFPVIILMHGCAGIAPGAQTIPSWRSFFLDNGYATVALESNLARGWPRDICQRAEESSTTAQLDRTAEAYAAARILRRLPSIRKDGIIVMGFSHGGGAALYLASNMAPKYWSRIGYQHAVEPINAVISHYPWCGRTENPIRFSNQPVTAPTLLQIGALDAWTPVEYCRALYEARGPRSNGRLELRVFEGAHHSFDNGAPVREGIGCGGPNGACGIPVRSGHNEDAFQQSRRNVAAFLSKHFGVR